MGPRELVLGLMTILVLVAGIVGLTDWLVPPGDPVVELDVPSPVDEPGPPGALDCPRVDELEPEPTPVSAGKLIDCPDVFDGRTVDYEGEVIEAVLPRGDHVVAFVNDDPYAQVGPLPEARTALGGNAGVPVVMPARIADAIRYRGDYGTRGDVVRVVGTYQPAAVSLGGHPAIIAEQAAISRRGNPVVHEPARRRVVVAVLFAMGAALLFLSGGRRDRGPSGVEQDPS